MKHSLKILLLLPFLVLLAGCGGTNPEREQAQNLKNTKSSGVITISDNDIDLGEIKMSDGKVDISFSFWNSGTEPVALLNGATSCMCTEAVVKSTDGVISSRIKMPGHGPTAQVNQVLEPGEEAMLIATFDPNAHGPQGTGPIMRTVTLETNSKKTPQVEFSFQGNVIP